MTTHLQFISFAGNAMQMTIYARIQTLAWEALAGQADRKIAV
jgi:hypothetical protein